MGRWNRWNRRRWAAHPVKGCIECTASDAPSSSVCTPRGAAGGHSRTHRAAHRCGGRETTASSAREPVRPMHRTSGCRDVLHSPTTPVHRSGIHPMRSTVVSTLRVDLHSAADPRPGARWSSPCPLIPSGGPAPSTRSAPEHRAQHPFHLHGGQTRGRCGGEKDLVAPGCGQRGQAELVGEGADLGQALRTGQAATTREVAGAAAGCACPHPTATGRGVGARCARRRRGATSVAKFSRGAAQQRPGADRIDLAGRRQAAQRIGVGQAGGVGVLDQVRGGVQTQRGVVGSKAAGRCGCGQLP